MLLCDYKETQSKEFAKNFSSTLMQLIIFKIKHFLIFFKLKLKIMRNIYSCNFFNYFI